MNGRPIHRNAPHQQTAAEAELSNVRAILSTFSRLQATQSVTLGQLAHELHMQPGHEAGLKAIIKRLGLRVVEAGQEIIPGVPVAVDCVSRGTADAVKEAIWGGRV